MSVSSEGRTGSAVAVCVRCASRASRSAAGTGRACRYPCDWSQPARDGIGQFLKFGPRIFNEPSAKQVRDFGACQSAIGRGGHRNDAARGLQLDPSAERHGRLATVRSTKIRTLLHRCRDSSHELAHAYPPNRRKSSPPNLPEGRRSPPRLRMRLSPPNIGNLCSRTLALAPTTAKL